MKYITITVIFINIQNLKLFKQEIFFLTTEIEQVSGSIMNPFTIKYQYFGMIFFIQASKTLLTSLISKNIKEC